MFGIDLKTAAIAITILGAFIYLFFVQPEGITGIFDALSRAVQDMIGTARDIDIPIK